MTSGVLTLLALPTFVGGYCACASAAAPSTAPGAHDIPAGGVVVPLFPDLPASQPDGGEVIVEDRAVNGQHDRVITVASSTLTVFLPEHPDANRPSVIICP